MLGSAEVKKHSEFMQLLQANTTRIQGGLVLFGYELQGGSNTTMIVRAALAVELFHAYDLCMQQGLDIDQAVRTAHEAEIILANLDAESEYRLKALSITNRTLMLATMSREKNARKENVLYWRATEAALNPIHVGQVLAGAGCDATNAVTPLALELGECVVTNKPYDIDLFVQKIRSL